MPPIKNPWLNMNTLSKLTEPTPYYSPNASYDPNLDPFAPGSEQALQAQQVASQGPGPQPASPLIQDPLLDRDPLGNGSVSASMRGPLSEANFSHFDSLMKQLHDQGISSQKDQGSQLENLQKYVNAMPDSASSTDLTGLNSLADAWGDGKSNFARDYQHPQTTSQAMAAKMASMGDLNKLQNNLSKDQLAVMQDQLHDELGKLGIQAHWGSLKAMKSGQQDDKVLQHLQDAMFKDKSYAGAQGIANQGPEVMNLIDEATKNPAAKNEVAIKMALFFNGGQRLNLPELEAQGGSQALQARFNQMLATSGKGTLSPENAAIMKQLIGHTVEGAQRMSHGIATDFANKARARTSYDGSTAYEKLTGNPYVNQPKTATRTAPTLSMPDLSTMTREQKLQYLQGQ